MHITMTFASQDRDFITLPIAFLYLSQALIYKMLPEHLSSFLHNSGYYGGGKNMKLFAMSWPHVLTPPTINGDHISFSTPMQLIVSTPVKDISDALLSGAMGAKDLRLGSNHLKCIRVSAEQQTADGNTLSADTMSPITCSIRDRISGRTTYFEPDTPEFREAVDRNLRRKFRALHPGALVPDAAVDITYIGDISECAASFSKKNNFTIKGWRGRFQLNGPEELLQTALDCGVGIKNSSGWGCITKANSVM